MGEILEDNVSNNIDNVVNNPVSPINGASIHINNEVHDGSKPFNEGVTKDFDLCNVSLHNEDIMLKWEYLYQIRTTLEEKLSKESLTFKEDN